MTSNEQICSLFGSRQKFKSCTNWVPITHFPKFCADSTRKQCTDWEFYYSSSPYSSTLWFRLSYSEPLTALSSFSCQLSSCLNCLCVETHSSAVWKWLLHNFMQNVTDRTILIRKVVDILLGMRLLTAMTVVMSYLPEIWTPAACFLFHSCLHQNCVAL